MPKDNNKKRLLAGGIIVLRFLQAPLIFFAPVSMAIVSIILDIVDSGILFGLGFSRRLYHHWDKLADFFWYCCILAYLIVTPISSLLTFIFIGLFIIRTLGLFLCYLKQNRHFLFYFPNIFECFFWFYLLAVRINPQLLQPPTVIYTLTLISLLKFIHEYYMHIKKIFYEFRLIPASVKKML